MKVELVLDMDLISRMITELVNYISLIRSSSGGSVPKNTLSRASYETTMLLAAIKTLGLKVHVRFP